MKSSSFLMIFWMLTATMVQAAADTSGTDEALENSSIILAEAETPTVLWDECNMKPDKFGVLSCYRLLSDMSEQDYYYLDDEEYTHHPISQ